MTPAPGLADVRHRGEQLAGLTRIDDNAPVHHLGHLRRLPLHPIERICRKLLQLSRIAQHIMEHRPLAPDCRRRSRRPVEAKGQRVERQADVPRLLQL